MQRHKAGLLLSEEFRGIVHMCGDYTPEKGENQSDCHSSSSHSLSFFLSVSSNGFPEIMHDRCMSTSFFSLSLSLFYGRASKTCQRNLCFSFSVSLRLSLSFSPSVPIWTQCVGLLYAINNQKKQNTTLRRRGSRFCL